MSAPDQPARKMRKIIHIDMDAFFASIEQNDTPEYRGKPLIVGGPPEGRGVVAACSYEARKFGIHSAMASARASRLCPQAIFVRPRHHRYQQVSAVIMNIFHKYTDLVEPLSLDEAFLDVTSNNSNEPSATVLAEIIRKEIFTTTGLTASAGVSCNKFVAKIASDINKPNGITVIPPEQTLDFITALPIRKFFGVGKVTEKKMLALGIRTGKDLQRWTLSDLCFHFGKTGNFLFQAARGRDDRPVEVRRVRKSIGSETTLAEDIDNPQQIFTILQAISEKIGKILETKKISGFTVTLKVRFADFTTISRSHTAHSAFTTGKEIDAILPLLLSMVPFSNRKVRLLGITISKLERNNTRPRQPMLPFMEQNVTYPPLNTPDSTTLT